LVSVTRKKCDFVG